MATLGYAISSEEHKPNDIVQHARLAESAGFPFALISDHFHPWTDAQGESPFVWSVIGGIAQATTTLRLGTGVTCLTVRIHPAVIAHAAATAATMMPGRFFLGVGSGEKLNEHVTGARWPELDERLAMLEEAIVVIRQLWQGEQTSHHGHYYTVENARIYTRPDELPPIHVAAAGPKAAGIAGRIGDGLISTSADPAVVKAFLASGPEQRPRYGQITVCWAKSESDAIDTAIRIWRNAGLHGELSQELPTPAHFEQACELVTSERIQEAIACGPDPEIHLAKIQAMVDAGFDHVYVHQVGQDQVGMIAFYEREILPKYN